MSRSRLGWLMFAAAVIVAFLILWPKVRFVFIIPLPPGGFVLLAAGLVLAVYLVLRLLLRR